MQISYVGPFDEVEVLGVGVVKRGESVSVETSIAGRVATPDEDPEKNDPGEGLLAQPSNWVAAKAPVSKKDEVLS